MAIDLACPRLLGIEDCLFTVYNHRERSRLASSGQCHIVYSNRHKFERGLNPYQNHALCISRTQISTERLDSKRNRDSGAAAPVTTLP